MDKAHLTLHDVLAAPEFPDVDVALRRGRHLDADDGALYTYLLEAEEVLAAFYERFECLLQHKADGYFYLVPLGDKIGKRQLGAIDMLLGQALTILYLDPATLERRSLVSRDEILAHLSNLVGADTLVRSLFPKRKRFDQRVAEEAARARVFEALRKLAGLGFVTLEGDEQVQLRRTLLRFAEPVRAAGDPSEQLASLAAAGELVLGEGGDEEDADDTEIEIDESSASEDVAAGEGERERPEPDAASIAAERATTAEPAEPAEFEAAAVDPPATPDEPSHDAVATDAAVSTEAPETTVEPAPAPADVLEAASTDEAR